MDLLSLNIIFQIKKTFRKVEHTKTEHRLVIAGGGGGGELEILTKGCKCSVIK